MVDIVTQAQAEEKILNADTEAAAEMAEQARLAAEQDKTEEAGETVTAEQKDWDDLLDDSEEKEVELPEEIKAEVKTEEKAVPEEDVTIEKIEDKTPEEIAKSEETKLPEVVKGETETPAPEDTRTPEEVQVEIAKARVTARDGLVDKFKWTEEQVEAFDDNPGVVMSEMAADLFLDLFDSVSQGLRMQMPGMVHGIMQQQKAQAAHDQAFFNAWPKLAQPEFRETVARVTAAYQQQNPQVPAETAIAEIGAQAWVALRLPLDELVAATQAPAAAETAAPVLTPSRTPASAGNTTQAAKVPVKLVTNDFEQLADELLLDDMQN